jgi:hypothetical protein
MINANTKSRSIRRLVLGTAAAAVAAMAIPSSGLAATSFGAKLNQNIQPSNSQPAHPCEYNAPAQPCTRVEMDAYNNAGHERAPKDGTIKQIKLIAGGAGSFRLQIAKANAVQQTAKVVEQGPTIHYQGQPNNNALHYEVETFNVNVPVKKGEYLATKSKKTSMVRCSSGGPNQLLFQPALSVGGPFEQATDHDGCWLLLQAVYS